MRQGIIALLVTGLILPVIGPASGGEAPAPAPAADPALREVPAQVQTVIPLPCITPREARDEHVRVTLAEGKGTLALPVKGGTLNLKQIPGGIAVELPGEGAGRTPQATGLPKEGFSAPLVVNLEYADKSTGIAALAFARGGKDGELFVRNMAVAIARAGDGSIFVFDDNCNGKYGEAGEDAVLAVGGRLAVPLGAITMIGGSPCSLQMSENGRKLTFKTAAVKLGAASLNTREGWGRLAGAVVKGPSGSFALRPDQNVLIPAESYELVYALAEDAAGRRAVVSGGSLKLDVPERGQAILPTLGQVKLDVQAGFDAATGKVTVEGPKAESITCAGGRVTYLFPLPAPDLRVVYLPTNTGTDTKENIIRFYKMPFKGEALTFLAGEAGMTFYRKYRLEMVWKVGVGPEPTGSAQVEVLPPPLPPKKK